MEQGEKKEPLPSGLMEWLAGVNDQPLPKEAHEALVYWLKTHDPLVLYVGGTSPGAGLAQVLADAGLADEVAIHRLVDADGNESCFIVHKGWRVEIGRDGKPMAVRE